MPTKPSAVNSEWASLVLHTIGPKSGQPTKIDEAGAAPDGHITGKNFPTTSNEFNSWCNKVSLLAIWTFEGSSAKDQDAHIVESQGSGLVSASALDIGGTTAPGPSMILAENVSGLTGLFLATNNDLLRLLSTHNDGLFHKTLIVDADADLVGTPSPSNSHIVHMEQDPDVSGEGPGCLLVETDTEVFDSANQPLAAISARNPSGVAGHFVGKAAVVAALVARNDGAGPSARFGYGGSESPFQNHGGLAIDAKGGPADDAPNIDGGDGAQLLGGDGVAGGNNTDAGRGALIQGGLRSSGLGGVGARIVAGAGDSPALEVRFNVEPAATSTLLDLETGDNLGTAIDARCEGAATGARIATQAGIGLLLLKTETGGGLVNEHIFLQAMDKDPTGTISSGSTWFRHYTTADFGAGASVSDDFIMRQGSIKRAFLTSAQGFTCYLRAQADPFVEIITDGAQKVVIAGAQFNPNDIPGKAGDVLITFACEIHHNGSPSTATNIITINITDDTGPPATVIKTLQYDTQNSGLDRQVYYSFVYTLPNPGQRAFSLGFVKNIQGAPEATSVRMARTILEIHELRAP